MKVLAVDDSKSVLAAVTNILSSIEEVTVETQLDPEAALDRALGNQFDLILVDYVMPRLDGIDLIRKLRAAERYRLVPIIMITSERSSALRLGAVKAGATDFVQKPFCRVELLARVRNLLALRSAQLGLADHARRLAAEVAETTRHIIEREEEVIWRLSRAIEFRDGTTGEHVSRVATVSRLIAEGLGFTPDHARTIYLAAPLHDIGKIAISDAILQKPGKLTSEEMEVMRRHVEFGEHILEGGSSDLIRTASAIAASHHEKWDGTGYPQGLSGETIPVEGRIVAIADVFDALCSERPYKRAWPVQEAHDEILRCSGSHFDPGCVDAFVQKWPQIEALYASGE